MTTVPMSTARVWAAAFSPARAFLAIAVLFLAAAEPASAAMNIEEIETDSGVTAWFVHDDTVPIVTIRFAFDGGTTQDPEGKAGLANLMTGLFDEGAGDLESAAFQKQLDVAGAEMSFDADRDAIYGSMRMLADRKDAAFNLLRLAVNEPRFDDGPVDRIRAQIKSSILADSRDPKKEAQIAFSKAIYGDHPYARREEGTVQSLDAITPEDIAAFHRRMFAKANLHVAVVGDIDAGTLKTKLDALFGALPDKPELRPVEKASLHLDQTVRIDYDLPQSTIRLAYPGVARDDPRFFAAYVMNHILGGGTFSSRLFDEVREKRGLAYWAGSSLVTHKYADLLMLGTATRSSATDRTLKIIRDVVRGMADDGVTEKELEEAKRNIIGGYAINNLDSSSAIARTLVQLQIENLGIDYIDRREKLIAAVTREQVGRIAHDLLGAEPAVMIVGPEAKAGDPM